LCRKVEACEVSHEWEARKLQSHVDAPGILASDLALAQQDERLPQGQILSTCFVQQNIELIANGSELQSRQHLAQRIREGTHQKPPPSSAS
jgi:hypothetical protein